MRRACGNPGPTDEKPAQPLTRGCSLLCGEGSLPGIPLAIQCISIRVSSGDEWMRPHISLKIGLKPPACNPPAARPLRTQGTLCGRLVVDFPPASGATETSPPLKNWTEPC